MKNNTVTLIIPVKNSETTLQEVLDSVEKQDYPIDLVMIVDNKSSDSSPDIMSKYAESSKFKVEVVNQTKDLGLAHSYNEAIKVAETSHIVSLQSDCVILHSGDFSKLMKAVEDKSVVVACSMQTTPVDVWNRYNFWQKCLFARHVGRVLSGRNGRFCCYGTLALRKVGSFDEKTYRTAGEDGDILLKLGKLGKIVDVEDIIVDHLHSRADNFSLSHYVYKENQLAEAVGACLSKNFSEIKLSNYKTAFIRPILVGGLLIPKLNIVIALMIVLFGSYLTKEVFRSEWRDWRIVMLPFVNVYLLFSYTYYFFKGMILVKQKL
ncbi:glycosyltransferase [Patescibacteria group bacterium]